MSAAKYTCPFHPFSAIETKIHSDSVYIVLGTSRDTSKLYRRILNETLQVLFYDKRNKIFLLDDKYSVKCNPLTGRDQELSLIHI